MNTQTHAFPEPDWANGYELDVSFDAFPDLTDDGENVVTAIYRETSVPAIDETHTCCTATCCVLDGVRINHPGGLVEYRGRAWLLDNFAQDVACAESLAAIDAGVAA